MAIEKQENGKTKKYKIRVIDSIKFMASFQLSLSDSLAEGLHEGECKNCEPSLEYMAATDVLLTFKCVHCNKTYEKKFDDDLSRGY